MLFSYEQQEIKHILDILYIAFMKDLSNEEVCFNKQSNVMKKREREIGNVIPKGEVPAEGNVTEL